MLRYILFVAGFAILMLGVMPLWGVVGSAQGTLSELQTVVDELRILQEKKNDLVKTYNAASDENLKKLDLMVPNMKTAAELSSIYVFMENTVKEHGLKLKKLDISTETDSGQVKPVSRQPVSTSQNPQSSGSSASAASSASSMSLSGLGAAKSLQVTFTAEGTYESFKNLLKSLELNLRLIDSSAVSITENLGRYSFDATLRMYYQ